MRRVLALVQASELAGLLKKLEPTGRTTDPPAKDIEAAIVVKSKDDPGRTVLFIVAKEAPDAKADGEARWLSEHEAAIGELITSRRATLCNVIFPGNWPVKHARLRVGRTPVRLLSAVQYLWADRLRVSDNKGDVEEKTRARLMAKLGGLWSDDEERQFTEPALAEAAGARAGEARELVLAAQPDIPHGGVTVIYGPGGIGKTFFLRRVTNLMAKGAVGDPLQGIPMFAELPLLLHMDALETWMSHAGINLPISEIRALTEAGVIVPVLDALDELVKGQAREGSREFLKQLRKTVEGHGKALLSSRDYYLNLDPLVQDELSGPMTAQLAIGYFGKAGRRRYIQMRTELAAQDAARWASQLETQASETLSGVAETDVEALIGHPLFLEAFSAMITRLPKNRRVVEADSFRLTSPDVFGEIVQKVLQREHDKSLPGWQVKFKDQFNGYWRDPFEPQLQKRVLRRLVLLTAADGAASVAQRELADPRYRELRHGVFTFTRGVPDGVSSKDALTDVIGAELGRPDATGAKRPEEAEQLAKTASEDLAAFYLQHALSDTRPDLPADLVFATRHRAYFDFILAEELLRNLQSTLASGDPRSREGFIEWCLRHHIFEKGEAEGPPFASCLDFVLWHPLALRTAINVLEKMFGPGSKIDDTVASYVFSLALAVALRASLINRPLSIKGRDFSSTEDTSVELSESIVPVIANLAITDCSFPNLAIRSSIMRQLTATDCDCWHLRITDSTWTEVRLDGLACPSIGFEGTCHFEGCEFILEEMSLNPLTIEPFSKLSFRNCVFSTDLWGALTEAVRLRPDAIKLQQCSERPRPAELEYSAGRMFVNKLMTLVRKHGHREFGVFSGKLRGKTIATSASYPRIIEVLQTAGAIGEEYQIIYLTPQAEKQMFSGKSRPGMRQYVEVESYWDPIVKNLDAVMS